MFKDDTFGKVPDIVTVRVLPTPLPDPAVTAALKPAGNPEHAKAPVDNACNAVPVIVKVLVYAAPGLPTNVAGVVYVKP